MSTPSNSPENSPETAASQDQEMQNGPQTSINPDEVAKFTAMADTWWDPTGPFKPLHKFNPIRINLLKKRLAIHFGRDMSLPRPFEGLTLLDVGCGGGLISEPMAEMGFQVTGIDASEKNIAIAQNHADRSGVAVRYLATSPENLAADGEGFDVVLALEVVEHVADLQVFMNAAAQPLKSGGYMALATLNRTLKSLALAKIGAEYILRWLPKGTHDWNDFVKPDELCEYVTAAGLAYPELKGLTYNPLTDIWRQSDDLSVNYMAFTTKP